MIFRTWVETLIREPGESLALQSLTRELECDLIAAFQISRPLVDAHPDVFWQSRSYLDFLIRISNLPSFRESLAPRRRKRFERAELDRQPSCDKRCQTETRQSYDERCQTETRQSYDKTCQTDPVDDPDREELDRCREKLDRCREELDRCREELEKCQTDLETRQNECVRFRVDLEQCHLDRCRQTKQLADSERERETQSQHIAALSSDLKKCNNGQSGQALQSWAEDLQSNFKKRIEESNQRYQNLQNQYKKLHAYHEDVVASNNSILEANRNLIQQIQILAQEKYALELEGEAMQQAGQDLLEERKKQQEEHETLFQRHEYLVKRYGQLVQSLENKPDASTDLKEPLGMEQAFIKKEVEKPVEVKGEVKENLKSISAIPFSPDDDEDDSVTCLADSDALDVKKEFIKREDTVPKPKDDIKENFKSMYEIPVDDDSDNDDCMICPSPAASDAETVPFSILSDAFYKALEETYPKEEEEDLQAWQEKVLRHISDDSKWAKQGKTLHDECAKLAKHFQIPFDTRTFSDSVLNSQEIRECIFLKHYVLQYFQTSVSNLRRSILETLQMDTEASTFPEQIKKYREKVKQDWNQFFNSLIVDLELETPMTKEAFASHLTDMKQKLCEWNTFFEKCLKVFKISGTPSDFIERLTSYMNTVKRSSADDEEAGKKQKLDNYTSFVEIQNLFTALYKYYFKMKWDLYHHNLPKMEAVVQQLKDKLDFIEEMVTAHRDSYLLVILQQYVKYDIEVFTRGKEVFLEIVSVDNLLSSTIKSTEEYLEDLLDKDRSDRDNNHH